MLASRKQRLPCTARLDVEPLEDRCTPASYSVSQLNVNGDTEYRLLADGFHFESIIQTAAGSVVSRSHPDATDANGFGSSVYLGPYINRGAPLGQVTSVTPTASGIAVQAGGNVATLTGTAGTWTTSYTFSYDAGQQKVLATGALDINLSGTLSSFGGDLTVSLTASNHLDNVPLQTGGVGDTGDMRFANVGYNGAAPDFTWNPELMPAHFPSDQTTSLTLDVSGEANVVDTLAQGKGFQIAEARKPGVKQTFTTLTNILTFGGTFDTSRGQDFSADNIGVLALVRQGTTSATTFHFDVSSESVPGPPIAQGDSYTVNESTRLPRSPGVTANDLAAYPASLRTILVSGPQHGSLSLNSDGSFTYTPVAGYIGPDNFTYKDNDGRLDGNTATVSLSVRKPLLLVAPVGSAGAVSGYDPKSGAFLGAGSPFGAYPGGMKVATGDVNGDGYADAILMGGPGMFNGLVLIYSGNGFGLLTGYQIPYGGELNLAAGDVNGDGKADVIVSTATDFDFVRVYSGATQNVLAQYSVFGGLRTGVTLAAGDFDGDGKADIFAGTANFYGGAVVVRGTTGARLATFLLPATSGGVSVAAGDVNGDGKADVILGTLVPAPGLGPLVAVYDAATQQLRGGFLAFPGQPVGVQVTTVDRDRDGLADIVTSFTGPLPVVGIYSGLTFSLLDGFFVQVGGPFPATKGLNAGGAS